MIGVPLGSYLLHIIQPDTFKLILGLFLMLWCPMMFFNPQFPRLQQSRKFADSWIGFLGGILGGLGGFCGSLPSTWVMLKNLSKQEQRYILRHFNFCIQLFYLTRIFSPRHAGDTTATVYAYLAYFCQFPCHFRGKIIL